MILILRSLCTVVLPLTFAFILLNDCGRHYIKFWTSMIIHESNMFNINIEPKETTDIFLDYRELWPSR